MATLARDVVYWDRAENSIRDWRTGVELPHYQGPCLVYFDQRGPTMMQTFMEDGKRCWREMHGQTGSKGNGHIVEHEQSAAAAGAVSAD